MALSKYSGAASTGRSHTAYAKGNAPIQTKATKSGAAENGDTDIIQSTNGKTSQKLRNV